MNHSWDQGYQYRKRAGEQSEYGDSNYAEAASPTIPTPLLAAGAAYAWNEGTPCRQEVGYNLKKQTFRGASI